MSLFVSRFWLPRCLSSFLTPSAAVHLPVSMVTTDQSGDPQCFTAVQPYARIVLSLLIRSYRLKKRIPRESLSDNENETKPNPSLS